MKLEEEDNEKSVDKAQPAPGQEEKGVEKKSKTPPKSANHSPHPEK